MAQRLVLIDDTNSNIQYSGPWFTARNTLATTGNFGPPFQDTLHGVNVDANFSFSFSGSSVTVLGTSITTNASGTQVPTWECFVDNNSIGWNTVLQFPENNWIFCQNNKLQDGSHVLRVQAKVSNQQTFWFDQIQYLPSSNVSLDQSMLRVDSADSALKYSSGWQSLNNIVNYTQTAGSTLTYQFSGTSLSGVGFVPGHFPLNSSSATYAIDGQTPNNFLVPALISTSEMEYYNQILFQTGQLSAGQHTLVVTHQGNSGTAPLAIDYFILQSAPSSSTSSSSNAPTHADATSSSVPSISSTSSPASTKPTGAIVGGVIGGLVLLSLLLILFLFIRRRSSRNAHAPGEKPYADIPYDIVDPFTAPPTHPRPTPTLSSQNDTSKGYSLTSQSIGNKVTHSNQPSDTATTSGNMISTFRSTDTPSSGNGGIPALTTLHNNSSPAITVSSSSRLPLAGSQTNGIDGSMTKAREAEGTQRSASSRSGDARFLRHEDSGIRLPPAENEVVELPPLYTPG